MLSDEWMSAGAAMVATEMKVVVMRSLYILIVLVHVRHAPASVVTTSKLGRKIIDRYATEREQIYPSQHLVWFELPILLYIHGFSTASDQHVPTSDQKFAEPDVIPAESGSFNRKK